GDPPALRRAGLPASGEGEPCGRAGAVGAPGRGRRSRAQQRQRPPADHGGAPYRRRQGRGSRLPARRRRLVSAGWQPALAPLQAAAGGLRESARAARGSGHRGEAGPPQRAAARPTGLRLMASRAPRGAAFLLLLAFLGTAGAQEEMSPGLRLRLDADCASCAGLTEHQQPAATQAICAAQVNLAPKGDLLVLLSQDGDVLVRDADFAALGLEARARRPQLVAGTPYVALRSVEVLAYEIDYERLALVLR